MTTAQREAYINSFPSGELNSLGKLREQAGLALGERYCVQPYRNRDYETMAAAINITKEEAQVILDNPEKFNALIVTLKLTL